MSLAKASVILVISLFAYVTAAKDGGVPEVSEKQMIDCITEADLQCAKLRAIADIFQFVKTKSVEVVDGVKLEYSGDNTEAVSAARSLADQGWNGLFSFIPKLVNGLSLKMNILPGGNLVVSKSRKENGLLDVSVESSKFEGRKWIIFYFTFR